MTAEEDAAAAAATAAASAPKPYYDGFDTETIGYLKNRGLDTKPVPEVVKNLADAHRQAQKLIGGDEKTMIRLPKDANDPAWKTVRQRLGAPADAKGYTFDGITFGDGTALDEGFVESMRATADAAGLSVQQAADVTRAIVKHLDATDANDAATKAQALATEKDALLKSWGANFNTNKLIADNAATKLGVTPEQIEALAAGIGGAKVMEMFRQIGEKIGEDRFVSNPAPGGKGPMTVEQATARKAEMMRDTEWRKRFDRGDVAARQELDNILTMIATAA